MRTDTETYATFALAHELGMTVSELRQRMSGAEFTMWMAYFGERNRREERAIRRGRRGR